MLTNLKEIIKDIWYNDADLKTVIKNCIHSTPDSIRDVIKNGRIYKVLSELLGFDNIIDVCHSSNSHVLENFGS